MGDFADDAMFSGLDEPWGYARRDYFRSAPPKRKNAQIFAAFAGEKSDFKTGDRVIHRQSGSRGVVISVRGSQVCWKPDTRNLPGGIWIDTGKLRFDI